jgi:hypothetical protein
MQIMDLHDRRRFMRLAAGLTAGAFLSGCGGGRSDEASEAIVVVPAPAAGGSPIAPTALTSHPLNLALNLAYLGAQFYSYAAFGRGLTGDISSGVGRPGPAAGARQASFSDPIVAGYAAELAADTQAHVVALRQHMGSLAAAQPTMDLSTGPSSAFSLAAQGASIVPGGASFDPYADDEAFLLGAFLVENVAAAAYRTLLVQRIDDTASLVLTANLADSIYHAGLVRSLLDSRTASRIPADRALGNTSMLLATIDGTDAGDQTLAGATGVSSDVVDADGRAIPFTRDTAQVLSRLYLSGNGAGGFLPAGANGIVA